MTNDSEGSHSWPTYRRQVIQAIERHDQKIESNHRESLAQHEATRAQLSEFKEATRLQLTNFKDEILEQIQENKQDIFEMKIKFAAIGSAIGFVCSVIGGVITKYLFVKI